MLWNWSKHAVLVFADVPILRKFFILHFFKYWLNIPPPSPTLYGWFKNNKNSIDRSNFTKINTLRKQGHTITKNGTLLSGSSFANFFPSQFQK